MLATQHRLRKANDFVAVYRKGCRKSTPFLTVRAWKCSNAKPQRPSRVGFSISQKVSKRAVIRNRIKRQLRSVCRQILPELQPGWDVVIVVRPEAVRCDYLQFLQQLRKLFAEAEILLNGY